MTVNTNQLYFILDHTPADQNIMLVGKHGIGKSQILENYYEEKGIKVVTLFLGQMSDPGDLIGLPEKNELTGKTDFMLPYWFPLDDTPIVLFLDELNRARPEVLQTIMDLTLNRKLAGKTLPGGSRIISAVNNGNEYQLTDLDPALVSRFNIYEFAPSVEDWLEWARKSGIDSRIIDFISENPEYLDSAEFEMDEGNLERTPDRRSWHRTSCVIKDFDTLSEREKPLVSGIIGNKATALFFKYVNEHNVPSASKILISGCFEKLSDLSVPELCQINTALFRFVESASYDKSQEEILLENFELYIDFLNKKELSEVEAHFISLCNSSTFPATLCLIAEKKYSLYEKILAFVGAQ
ncbi:MAG: AAA family ATPase [Treponema sp.]|nr:AAA family ATPase [Treponema sp.]